MADAFFTTKIALYKLLMHVREIDSGGFPYIMNELRIGYNIPVPEETSPGARYIQYLDAILRRHGALPGLADLLRAYYSSPAAESFAKEARNVLPTDLLSLDEWLNFARDMSSLVPPAKYQTYYQAVAGNPDPRVFSSVQELLREIEQLTPRPNDPLVALTEVVAQDTNVGESIRTARRWGDLLAERRGEVDQSDREQRLLEERRREGVRIQPAPGRPTLVFQLAPSGHTPQQKYQFSASFFLGDEFVEKMEEIDDSITLDAVPPAVIDVLEATSDRMNEVAEADRESEPDIDLEFILPRWLLCYPVEEWTYLPAPDLHTKLKWYYVVVVRDYERHHHATRLLHLRRKWKRAENCNGADPVISQWITCEDSPDASGQLPPVLPHDECVSVGFTFPPADARAGQLNEVLDSGTPVAVWSQLPCDHSGTSPDGTCPGMQFKKNLSKELTGKQLAELPGIVRTLRQDRSHPDWQLALLWDNPWRIMSVAEHSLDVPRSLEGL